MESATSHGRQDSRAGTRGADDNPVAVLDQAVRSARNWLVATGILAIVGGLAAIVVPAVASVAITLFIGWVLVFAGGVMGAHAWQMRGRGHGGARILNALLTFALGVVLVIFPLGATITLTVLLAAWFAASGALLLAGGLRARRVPGAGMMIFNGGLSLVLGLLIAVDLPSSAGWAIGLLVGIHLVFWGVRALAAATWLHRVRPPGGAAPPQAAPPTPLAWTS
jgi:uncharacterized membrane protein HdeD (DUF308 family)